MINPLEYAQVKEHLDDHVRLVHKLNIQIQQLESQLEVAVEALEEISKWSECYCPTDEESCKPGGMVCPICISKEAVSKIKEMEKKCT